MVRIAVDAPWARWVTDEVGADAVQERRNDGSVIFALGVTNTDGFRSFVLGLLDHVEVLSPSQVRHAVVTWLTTLTEEDGEKVGRP